MKRQLGLQLYTLRKETQTELAEALRQAACNGYTGVEFAGFYDLPAEALAGLLRETGLTAYGAHIELDTLENETPRMARFLQGIGCRNAVIPYADLSDEERLQKQISRMNALLPVLKAQGIRLLYHNHTQEFIPVDGQKPIDRLLRETGVLLELDTFWAHTAGEDVCAFMRKHRSRVALVHLKDGDGGKPCAIGEGSVPCRRFYDLARELNVMHVIVENDNPSPDGYRDIARSMCHIVEHFV